MDIKDELGDLYALERAMEKALEQHARDAAGTLLSQGLTNHMLLTRSQQQRLKAMLGGEVKEVKGGVSAILRKMQGMMKTGENKILSNTILDYAAEHLEIAIYRSMIIAAEKRGETQLAALLRQILSEEEQMASWLDSMLPHVALES